MAKTQIIHRCPLFIYGKQDTDPPNSHSLPDKWVSEMLIKQNKMFINKPLITTSHLLPVPSTLVSLQPPPQQPLQGLGWFQVKTLSCEQCIQALLSSRFLSLVFLALPTPPYKGTPFLPNSRDH